MLGDRHAICSIARHICALDSRSKVSHPHASLGMHIGLGFASTAVGPRCPTHMTGHDAHSTDQMCFIGSVDLQTVDVTRSMYVDGSSPGIPRIIPPAR